MSDDCCQRIIDVSALQARQRRVLMVVLTVNVVTFIMMVAAAMLSGSSSLLSGALDNFGDSLTYVLSLAVIGAANTAKAKVALFKGFMISAAAVAVAVQIGWRAFHPETPIFETMGVAALLNLGANVFCLRLLTPYRDGDVNMSSAWECSRNDVTEGFVVIAATLAVWALHSGWPDLVAAVVLLIVFLRSAIRVVRGAWLEMHEIQRNN